MKGIGLRLYMPLFSNCSDALFLRNRPGMHRMLHPVHDIHRTYITVCKVPSPLCMCDTIENRDDRDSTAQLARATSPFGQCPCGV